MDPDAFTIKPGAGELALYRHAVRDAYVATDRLVGSCRELARQRNATIIFATALSQQPFLRYEEQGGQNFYRLHDVATFLRAAGIPYRNVSPTMTHQYLIECGGVDATQTARHRLEQFTDSKGRQVFGFPSIESDPSTLYFGCQISRAVDGDETILDGKQDRKLPFSQTFYRIDALKSGRHHPDGCLWIATGKPHVHEERVSILDILPTQLEIAGVTESGLQGTTLVKCASG